MVAPHIAKPTVGFVDEYCEHYRDLFVEVRSYEAFKHRDGKRETRYIREIVYGKRLAQRYWQLTTDPATLPSASQLTDSLAPNSTGVPALPRTIGRRCG